MYPISEQEEIDNPNAVKVIVNLKDQALYFSRAAIPFLREGSGVQYFRHKGVYAFRKEALEAFPKMVMGPLEKAEKIEAIRYLEHGHAIQMVRTTHVGIGIDVPEDLEKARREWGGSSV